MKKHLIVLSFSLLVFVNFAKAQTVDLGIIAGQSFGIDFNYFKTESDQLFNFFGGYIAGNGMGTDGEEYENISFGQFREDIVEEGTRSVIGGLRAGHLFENTLINKTALFIDLGIAQNYDVQNRRDNLNILGDNRGRYYIEQKAGMDLGIGFGLKRLTKLKKVTLSYGAFVNSATGINLTLGIKLF